MAEAERIMATHRAMMRKHYAMKCLEVAKMIGMVAGILLTNLAIAGLFIVAKGERTSPSRRYFNPEVRCYGDERPAVRMEETLKGYTIYIEDCGIPDERLDNR